MPIGTLVSDKWQVQWRDTLLGWPATNMTISNVTGWLDKPNTRSGSQDRTGRHGQSLGALNMSGRQITVDFTDLSDLDDTTAYDNLLAITATGEDDGEEPLVIYLHNSPQLAYARCEKLSVPTDRDYSNGYRRVSALFAATDPRRYGLTETFPSIGLPQAGSGGFVFPAVAPFYFGAGLGSQILTAVNTGTVPLWPLLTLTGPLVGPIITNTDTGDQLLFDPAFTLAASQQLVIDTDLKSVTLATGEGRRSALFVADWFPLHPGATRLSLTSVGTYDPSASLAVGWRDGGIRDAYA